MSVGTDEGGQRVQGHRGKSKWIKEGLANGKARKYCNRGPKSSDTCISGASFQFTQAQPSPHPTNNVGRVYPEFEFQLCVGWGEGELQENLETDALS